jgi:ubiquinone/menaquinone biosynthesis C-methylase UbiE
MRFKLLNTMGYLIKRYLIIVIIFSGRCFSQDIEENEVSLLIEKCGGVYFPNKKIISDSWGSSLSFFDIKEGEKIADIGSKSMTFIGILSVFSEKATFYCEDIDSSCTTQEQADKVIKYYSKIKEAPISNIIIPVIGNEKTTTLPSNFFDKVIIDNSLHEFSDKETMLKDIFRILKKGGKLYDRESLGRKNGEIHIGCNNKLFDENTLINLVSTNGFQYVNSIDSRIPTGAYLSKIFLFKKE